MKYYLAITALFVTSQFTFGKTVWINLSQVEDNYELVIDSITASESLTIRSFSKVGGSLQAVVDGNIYSVGDSEITLGNEKIFHGPLTLQIVIQRAGGTQSNGFITYDINPISSSTATGTQNTATVIPENSSTDVDIILEQSTDLVNWTPADPGTYTPSDKKRFFRVRAQSK